MLRSRTPRISTPLQWGDDVQAHKIIRNRNRWFRIRNHGRHRRLVVALICLVFCFTLWLLSSLRSLANSVPSDLHAQSNILPLNNHGGRVSNHTIKHSKHNKKKQSLAGIPLVDRSVLLKLHHTHNEEDREPGTDAATPGSARKPPLVTLLPDREALQESNQTAQDLDMQFCARAPCRLLLPVSLPEKEPKAQEHFAQLAALARSLNRTLVLPHVARGKVGACLRWDLGTYFDLQTVVRLSAQPVMTMDNFRSWADMRSTPPTGQSMSVTDSVAPDSTDRVLWFPGDNLSVGVGDSVFLEDTLRRSGRCLKTRFARLRVDAFAPLVVHLLETAAAAADSTPSPGAELAHTFAQAHINAATSFANSTTQEDVSPDPDVLLVHWDTRRALFPRVPLALQYSPALRALADHLAAPTSPHLVVHWTADKTPAGVLPACAEALVDTLYNLLHDEDLAGAVRTVWIASDMPLDGAPSQGHPAPRVEAADAVREAFGAAGDLSRWRMTSLAEELKRIANDSGATDDESVQMEDPGFVAILEKVIAMNAALYVTSRKNCGSVSSSSRQIVDYRAQAHGENLPRNVVDLFG